MSSPQLLPPSERDFLIYRLAKVDHCPTREIAEACGLSQTRICQIVRSVAEHLVEVAPEGKDDAAEGRRVNAARWLAGERLEYLIQQAEKSWQKSKEDQVINRDSGRTRITRSSAGDPRYLMAAARLLSIAARFPLAGVPISGLSARTETSGGDGAATIDALAGKGAKVAPSASPAAATRADNCSAPAREQPATASPPGAPPTTNPAGSSSCGQDKMAPATRATNAAQPVQSKPKDVSTTLNLDAQLPHPLTDHERERDPSRRKSRRAFLAAAG